MKTRGLLFSFLGSSLVRSTEGEVPDWEPWLPLPQGDSVRSLGKGCPSSRYAVSPGASLVLETVGLGTGYPEGLRCRSQFRAVGDCKLLLQCPEFHLQDAKEERCIDFLLVKDSNGEQTRHCGEDSKMGTSRNHGTRMMLLLRTKQGAGGPGLRCRVSCCPTPELSSTQVSLDREAPAQECLATRQENSDTCGILGSPAKIVGGEEARRHQYTWLAMLTRAGEWRTSEQQLAITGLPRNHEAFCGGSLVSQHWILTASHCTLLEGGKLEPQKYRVVLGAWDRNDQHDSFVRVYRVTQQLRHSHYNEATYDSDIALWKLAKPADPLHFRPICLPWPNLGLRNPMTVAGWGIQREGSSQLAGRLQQVNVTVVSTSRCESALKPYPVTSNMLCAGGQKGKDACQGDSGGPLMGTYPQTDQVFLAGVVSWGIGCGRKGKYGVYTKVSHYAKWFQRIIKT